MLQSYSTSSHHLPRPSVTRVISRPGDRDPGLAGPRFPMPLIIDFLRRPRGAEPQRRPARGPEGRMPGKWEKPGQPASSPGGRSWMDGGREVPRTGGITVLSCYHGGSGSHPCLQRAHQGRDERAGMGQVPVGARLPASFLRIPVDEASGRCFFGGSPGLIYSTSHPSAVHPPLLMRPPSAALGP